MGVCRGRGSSASDHLRRRARIPPRRQTRLVSASVRGAEQPPSLAALRALAAAVMFSHASAARTLTPRGARLTRTAPDLDAAVQWARARLDAHVRETIRWHFSPETGCPFWLEYAEKLGWDPRREVEGYGDLKRFPPFEDAWLRGGPVRRWLPRALAGRDRRHHRRPQEPHRRQGLPPRLRCVQRDPAAGPLPARRHLADARPFGAAAASAGRRAPGGRTLLSSII
jgi:hypothetical protein